MEGAQAADSRVIERREIRPSSSAATDRAAQTAPAAPRTRSLWKPGIDFLVVPAVFLVVGLLLQGDGRVPLGDSWVFSWTEKQLVEHGRLVFSDVQAMTLVGQMLLAWPVAAVFSPTPSVLNHFTLVLSAITLDLFLLVYRRLGIGRGLSLLGVAAVAINPIWLIQSMAFETEIPFLFFSALGALALLEWDRSGRDAALWRTGLAFAGAAAVRQHALIFPFAWFVYAWPAGKVKPRSLLPWLMPPLVVGMVYLWIHWIGDVPRAFGWQKEMVRFRWSDPYHLATSTAYGVLSAMHYLGGFLVPVSVVAASTQIRRGQPMLAACCVLLAASTIVLWFGYGLGMPYLPHLLQPIALLVPLGLGDQTRTVELVWTILSMLAGIVLLAALFHSDLVRGVDHRETPAGVSHEVPAALRFFAATAVFMIGFNLMTGLGFDRYFLPPLPFVIPVLLYGRSPSVRRMQISALLLVASAAGSALLVDQRIRSSACEWDLAESLRDGGVAPIRINGGVAFNGYYLYETMAETWKGRKHGVWVPWFQPQAEYLLTAAAPQRPGLTLVDTHRCANLPGFLPLEVRTYTCAPRGPLEASTLCQPF